jgi:hypothetical protein
VKTRQATTLQADFNRTSEGVSAPRTGWAQQIEPLDDGLTVPVKKTLAAEPGGSLDLEATNGSDTVTGGDHSGVLVVVRIRFDDAPREEMDKSLSETATSYEMTNGIARIHGPVPDDDNWWDGSLTVRNLDGTVEGETAGGSVAAERITGDVDVETARGDIESQTLPGAVDARTSASDVALRATAAPVTAETSVADVVVEWTATALSADPLLRLTSSHGDAHPENSYLRNATNLETSHRSPGPSEGQCRQANQGLSPIRLC